MKIILDAFGGDNAPLEILKGCELAIKEYGIDILLTGSEEIIRKVASENNISLDKLKIIDAPDVITMEDDPLSVVKAKKTSSMAEGFRRLAAGEGDAFVSAGNSGAMVTGWNLIGGKWYYMHSTGSMAFNQWIETNGKWYYVTSDGSMAVNTTIDGYKVDQNGVWVK